MQQEITVLLLFEVRLKSQKMVTIIPSNQQFRSNVILQSLQRRRLISVVHVPSTGPVQC